ncbi:MULTISPECIES: geranylgeranylglyceryl/heptaprenylglyceryl phosphate synthase [unclassified Flavobacterium]|uniref:geranylgeranylglyceryl/heptaprenylglyceryl phosphate synthase n=1 Tax=unclassified Flavobacterium TaxID=196869 RepID=UPI003F8EB2C2
MVNIYNKIVQSKKESQKLLAILLDPDKIVWEDLHYVLIKINQSPATHIFIGGSHVTCDRMDELIKRLKHTVNLPIVLFPGDPSQISNEADAILFLSLLSGRNPDYLIAHQVKAAPILKKMKLEVIPTGYILIESGNTTAVARVSKTTPIDRDNLDLVLATALAGEMMGNLFIYLEAGSGAKQAVSSQTIELVAQNIKIPLIVGGGIVDLQSIEKAYVSGADLVVIGTAFEKNYDFFDAINK